MARSYDMTKGSIWKNILCFSIPIMVSNLIQSTYNAVDMLLLGVYWYRKPGGSFCMWAYHECDDHHTFGHVGRRTGGNQQSTGSGGE